MIVVIKKEAPNLLRAEVVPIVGEHMYAHTYAN